MTQYEPHHFGVWLSGRTAASNLFTLGVSELGGTDVLGNNVTGGGYAMVNVQPYVTEVTYSNGITLTGLDAEGDGVQVSIRMKATTDLFKTYKFRTGSPVYLSLENLLPGISSHNWFVGIATSYSREMDAEGNFFFTVNASDLREQALATYVDELIVGTGTGYVQAYTNMTALVDASAGKLGQAVGVNLYSTIMPELDIADTPIADSVLNIARATGSWLVSQYHSTATYTSPTAAPVMADFSPSTIDSTVSPLLTFADNETDGHIAIDNLDAVFDNTARINDFALSITGDPLTTLTYTDQDAVDLYGKNSQTLELDVRDTADLTQYMNRAKQTTHGAAIQGLSAPAIAVKNRKLHETWQLFPGCIVKVEVTRENVTIDANFVVTRVEHSITPDTWETKLGLWRNDSSSW